MYFNTLNFKNNLLLTLATKLSYILKTKLKYTVELMCPQHPTVLGTEKFLKYLLNE